MIKISDVVEEIIRNRPFLEQTIFDGLVNTTALARLIKPEIEHRLGKSVQMGAVVMAIKRLPMHPVIHSKRNLHLLSDNMRDLTVRSRLVVFNYVNSANLTELQSRLLGNMGTSDDYFYTFSRGIHESTLVVSSELADTVADIFAGEQLKYRSEQMSAITIKLKHGNIQTPGLYYHILKQIAWQNINLSEVISTTNEFTLIMQHAYVNKALEALSGFLVR